MRKLLLSTFLCLFAWAVQAQYYYVPHLNAGVNPGNINNDAEYPVGGGLPTGWNVLMAGSSSTATTPVWSPSANLPFAFNFNGSPVTSYKVSTSGVLTFTTSAVNVPAEANVALPSASIPDKSVCVWGMSAVQGDNIVTKTFGSAPNRQHWVMFNSFSQTGTANLWTYWSIVLEETTNKIYIVDQRTANGAVTLTLGVQIDATTAEQVNGSPNINSLSSNDPTPADNSYYEFIPGTRPAYDMAAKTITLNKFLIRGQAPFNIAGSLTSLGSATVNSFTLNYNVNNGTVVSAPITGVNIQPQGNYNYSHPTPWTPATTGSYTIKVWASNINGNADQNVSNDTVVTTVQVEDAFAQRMVLHEVFTSSTCPPCKPGNANLHSVTAANPGKSIDIKYQQNYPGAGDPYNTQESRNRHNYYGVTGIPHMNVDGGWGQNANSYTSPLLNQFHAKPSFVEINSEHVQNGQSFTVTATINPLANINSSNLVVHMAITEKITKLNVRSNGETEFYDVMKKMLPNENGSAIATLVKNTPVTVTQSYTFPATNTVENFDSLQVVVFVQDKVTKEVFQSAYSVRKTQNPSGVSKDIAAANLAVYPNPFVSATNVAFTLNKPETVTVTVHNILGDVVYKKQLGTLTADNHQLEIDLSNQSQGMYILNLTVGQQTVTKKVTLVK